MAEGVLGTVRCPACRSHDLPFLLSISAVSSRDQVDPQAALQTMVRRAFRETNSPLDGLPSAIQRLAALEIRSVEDLKGKMDKVLFSKTLPSSVWLNLRNQFRGR